LFKERAETTQILENMEGHTVSKKGSGSKQENQLTNLWGKIFVGNWKGCGGTKNSVS